MQEKIGWMGLKSVDLNLIIEIPDYHGSLKGDDFLEWFASIERVF